MLQKISQQLSLTILALCVSIVSFAQDGTKKLDVDIDVNKGGDSGAGFLNNPVVWIIGAAVFILLLVALMRGNKRSA